MAKKQTTRDELTKIMNDAQKVREYGGGFLFRFEDETAGQYYEYITTDEDRAEYIKTFTKGVNSCTVSHPDTITRKQTNARQCLIAWWWEHLTAWQTIKAAAEQLASLEAERDELNKKLYYTYDTTTRRPLEKRRNTIKWEIERTEKKTAAALGLEKLPASACALVSAIPQNYIERAETLSAEELNAQRCTTREDIARASVLIHTENKPQATETATEGENVAKVGNTPAETKNEAQGVKYGLFSFSDVESNSHAPELLTTFATEAEALKQMEKNQQGAGMLSLDACDILASGGGYWFIYYTWRCNGYICDFIAPITERGDMAGALLKAEEWGLTAKLLQAKKDHLSRQFIDQLAEVDAGLNYNIGYNGDRLTVEADDNNAGRYIVTWWECEEMEERHTNQSSTEAAEAVGAWIVATVPAYESKKLHFSHFATHDSKPETETKTNGTRIYFAPGDCPELEELNNTQAEDERQTTHDASKPAQCQAGGVWQFVQKLASGEELHEIRNRGGWFELVVNICDRFGGGQSFPDKFATYAAAFEALQRFRPGSRLWSTPYAA